MPTPDHVDPGSCIAGCPTQQPAITPSDPPTASNTQPANEQPKPDNAGGQRGINQDPRYQLDKQYDDGDQDRSQFCTPSNIQYNSDGSVKNINEPTKFTSKYSGSTGNGIIYVRNTSRVYEKEVAEAIDWWNAQLGGHQQFKITDSQWQAQIRVFDTGTTTGRTLASYTTKTLLQEDEIALVSPMMKNYSHDDVVTIIKHEFGHSLGLFHNCRGNLMFFQSGSDQPGFLGPVDKYLLHQMYGI